MPRGPAITQDEINRAHELKAQGLKPPQIKERLQRSLPTVYKLLAMPKQEQPQG